MGAPNRTERLSWTRGLAEQFWQGAYDANLKWLAPITMPERHFVAALLPRVSADKRITLFLERDDALDFALRFAGYETNRLDVGLRNKSTDPCPVVPVCNGLCEFIVVPEALAQLLDDEIGAFFQVVRSSLKAGGRICLTVPNGEILDQNLTIDPLSAAMYHYKQRLRSFSPATLEEMISGFGFKVEVLQQLEFSDAGFAGAGEIKAKLAGEPRAHVGNGETLFVVARKAGATDEARPANAIAWCQAVKTARAQAHLRPEPTAVEWSDALIERFWSYVANTPLDDLSFGVVNSDAFLQAVSPWLSEQKRYLDLGAGDGFLAELMLKHGFPVATLEPAVQRRAVLNRRLSHLSGYLGTIENLNGIAPFDCIIATEVIEHVSTHSTEGFVKAIRDALLPGGILILSTPRGEDLDESKMYSPVSGAVYHRWQHLQSWSADGLGRVLTDQGFQIFGMYDVDFSAIKSLSSPYVDLLLARRESATVGKGGTLLCIAQRASADGEMRLPTDLRHREFVGGEVTPDAPAHTGSEIQTPSQEEDVQRGYMTLVIDALRAVGRKLPLSVKRRLAPLAVRIESLHLHNVAHAVYPLKDFSPLMAGEEFSSHEILQVNNALAWGGVERQIVTLLRHLEQRGHSAHLLCLRLGESQDNDFYKPSLSDYSGVIRNAMTLEEARRVLQTLLPAQRRTIGDALRWLPSDVQNEIERFIAEFIVMRPHAVHAWQDSISLAAGFAAHIVGIPKIVISSRNLNPTNFAYFRPYMQEAYRQLAACKNILMVNNSVAGAADYASWLGIEADRFGVHRNGVDPNVFSKAAADDVKALRRRLGIPDGARVVGSLFRFYPEKNPLLWAEMARHVAAKRPDVHFVVFGVGPMKDDVYEFAKKHKFAERMHLPGAIQAPNLALGLYDVFVLTSQFEGTPNVVIEASLLGVPVVTTAAGGAAETVESGRTGLVDYSWNAEELATKVLAILDDPTWAERARLHGPAFISERFGLERMVDEALTFYGFSADRKPF